MNPLIARVAHDAAAPLEAMIARLLKKVALVALGMGCVIAASVFLTIDLFAFIQTLAGTLVAALSVAALFLIAAIVCLWLASRPERAATAAAQPLAAVASKEAQDNLPKPNPEFVAKIDAIVAPILEILRQAGLEKEALAVEAGAEIAKQLNAFSLVGFAIVAGVVIGRILRSKRALL
ncbi:MAG: hypothetical protein WDN46_13605 [Methylocella sp.]